MSSHSRRAGNGSDNGSYHRPRTVEDLTRHNIETVARLEAAMLDKRTFSDKVADVIAAFCGSMAFVWVHIAWFGAWIVINTIAPIKHLDPFPFQFLTLIVSLEAIFLSTFVLIGQNRQAAFQRAKADNDYQDVNVLLEENTRLTRRIHDLTEELHRRAFDGQQTPLPSRQNL